MVGGGWNQLQLSNLKQCSISNHFLTITFVRTKKLFESKRVLLSLLTYRLRCLSDFIFTQIRWWLVWYVSLKIEINVRKIVSNETWHPDIAFKINSNQKNMNGWETERKLRVLGGGWPVEGWGRGGLVVCTIAHKAEGRGWWTNLSSKGAIRRRRKWAKRIHLTTGGLTIDSRISFNPELICIQMGKIYCTGFQFK